MIATGQWHVDDYPENAALVKGMTQDYLGALKAFHPGELRRILEDSGLRVTRLGGLGTLSWLCMCVCKDFMEKVTASRDLFERFLDLCERYDRDILPDGPGISLRAGMIAVAERSSSG